jgi:8-oxo-dGTP diphosphatase / 2-hydroxy-dATP diphosphatase
MKKVLTLCLVEKDGQVLLGMKKRGFGAGHYNGFGGKVEEHETIEGAAARELFEEASVTALSLEKIGQLAFTFRDEPDLELEMHIFKTKDFIGVPVESEEMQPQWFDRDSIPYSDMWSSDASWFLLFLSGQKFTGSFHFDRPASPTHTAVILEQKLILVEHL